MAKAKNSYNTLAILSLVFAFIFAPLGIVFGIVALVQMKKSKEEGKTFAIVGIVLSVMFLLLWFLVIGAIMFFTISSSSSGLMLADFDSEAVQVNVTQDVQDAVAENLAAS